MLRNEKGIALVMVLVLSVMSLAIVAALLFMVTQGTQTSGSLRYFRNAEEAAIGGAEIAAQFINGRGALNLAGINLLAVSNAAGTCLDQKMRLSRGGWTSSAWTSCLAADLAITPSSNPDLVFETNPGGLIGENFRVRVKIVDTVKGNTNVSNLISGGGIVGGSLGGYGVTEVGVVAGGGGGGGTGNMITAPPIPYLYRLELQAEAFNNPREKALFSGLYAY
jgi:hypothetical protein